MSRGVMAVVAWACRAFGSTELFEVLAAGRGGSGGGCSSWEESLSCPILTRSPVASQGGLKRAIIDHPKAGVLRDPDASGTAILSIMPLRAGSGDDGGGASMRECRRGKRTLSFQGRIGALLMMPQPAVGSGYLAATACATPLQVPPNLYGVSCSNVGSLVSQRSNQTPIVGLVAYVGTCPLYLGP